MIKTILHNSIQLHSLFGSLQVSHKRRVVYETPFPQAVESRQKSFRSRESTDINISTPGLLQNPSEQTESMQPCAEIILCRINLQRFQYLIYFRFLHHYQNC